MLIASGRAHDRTDAKAALSRMPPGELAAWARGAGARDVLTAYEPLPGMGMIVMPLVFGDDVVLPSEPYLERLRRADGWSRVPVMLGTNHDENKLFLFASPLWVRRWFGIVPRLIEPDRYDAVGGTMSTMWKATGVDEPAAAMRASGATDVYTYRFDWDEEPTLLGADLSRMLGACHGLEIPFVFGHFDLGREANRMFTLENEPGRTKLADAMMSYWTEFASKGRPGAGRDGTLPPWPAATDVPRARHRRRRRHSAVARHGHAGRRPRRDRDRLATRHAARPLPRVSRARLRSGRAAARRLRRQVPGASVRRVPVAGVMRLGGRRAAHSCRRPPGRPARTRGLPGGANGARIRPPSRSQEVPAMAQTAQLRKYRTRPRTRRSASSRCSAQAYLAPPVPDATRSAGEPDASSSASWSTTRPRSPRRSTPTSATAPSKRR